MPIEGAIHLRSHSIPLTEKLVISPPNIWISDGYPYRYSMYFIPLEINGIYFVIGIYHSHLVKDERNYNMKMIIFELSHVICKIRYGFMQGVSQLTTYHNSWHFKTHSIKYKSCIYGLLLRLMSPFFSDMLLLDPVTVDAFYSIWYRRSIITIPSIYQYYCIICYLPYR